MCKSFNDYQVRNDLLRDLASPAPDITEAELRRTQRLLVRDSLRYSVRGNRSLHPSVLAVIRAARRVHTESIARQAAGW